MSFYLRLNHRNFGNGIIKGKDQFLNLKHKHNPAHISVPMLLHWHICSYTVKICQVNVSNGNTLPLSTLCHHHTPRVNNHAVSIATPLWIVLTSLSSCYHITLTFNCSSPKLDMEAGIFMIFINDLWPQVHWIKILFYFNPIPVSLSLIQSKTILQMKTK